MQDVLSCPICSSPRRVSFAMPRDAGRTLTYLACRRCGHVYQSPRMDARELEAFYSGQYRLLQQGTPDPVSKDLLAQAARAVVTLRLTGDLPRNVSRHLDVGSSSGALIEAFRARFGCAGVGIEPGEAYLRYSLARGVATYPSTDDLAKAGEGPFDLVTAMHVLEHVADPVGELTRLRVEQMVSGAHLLVEVPNLADHQAFELAHLHAFTPSSLSDAVRRAGFHVVWSRVHGGYRSPVLRLYITVFAQAEDRPSKDPTYLPFASVRSRLSRRIGVAKREFFTRYFPDWTWQSPEMVLTERQAR